jgi:hypothetical protein
MPGKGVVDKNPCALGMSLPRNCGAPGKIVCIQNQIGASGNFIGVFLGLTINDKNIISALQ